ncbi:hypothetical protein AHIS1_p042 [Acaryochloris phage A-HIS1]|nr:hypothetical protein AHIS1_p042 [Acaryochloris phage A-HIS1]
MTNLATTTTTHEIYIDPKTGESGRSLSSFARLTGLSVPAIRYQIGLKKFELKTAEMQTAGGLQGVKILDENQMNELLWHFECYSILKATQIAGIRALNYTEAGVKLPTTRTLPSAVDTTNAVLAASPIKYNGHPLTYENYLYISSPEWRLKIDDYLKENGYPYVLRLVVEMVIKATVTGGDFDYINAPSWNAKTNNVKDYEMNILDFEKYYIPKYEDCLAHRFFLRNANIEAEIRKAAKKNTIGNVVRMTPKLHTKLLEILSKHERYYLRSLEGFKFHSPLLGILKIANDVGQLMLKGRETIIDEHLEAGNEIETLDLPDYL